MATKEKKEKDVFICAWRNTWNISDTKSIDDFIHTFQVLTKFFKNWKRWGITLLESKSIGDEYATFCTDDIKAAVKAGFYYWHADDKETKYLETISGREIKISDEILREVEDKKES